MAGQGISDADGARLLQRARWRLIPFMFVLYVVSYLDRINVGFAALQMNADLGFGASTYGLGAGIFFLSYVAFEIPSNLVMARVGARVWIARIMITWGLVSAGMMFVSGTSSFYVLRFLLGVAEAGFFPGMILYLTYWFPDDERARAVALFMTATALAGVVGGPVSGALLSLHQVAGLAGWQWLFLVEGLPAVALGIVVLVYLDNGPAEAKWLTDAERVWLTERLARDHRARHMSAHHSFRRAAASRRVWQLALIYFAIVAGFYGISFWLPQIVQGASNRSPLEVGLVSALPYVAAAVGMVWVGRHSDRTGERRGHVAVAALVGAAGLVAASQMTALTASVVCLSVAALGIWSALGPFWALPTMTLSGPAAAGGIALINSVGNVGGFVGPYLVGFVRERTASFSAALMTLAALLVVGAALTIVVDRERPGSR